MLNVGAEVGPGSGGDAVRAAAEVDGVEVALEYLVLCVLAVQLHRDHDLADLPAQGAVTGQVGVLDELLGDCRTALRDLAAGHIRPQRAHNTRHGDARLAVEVPVFRGEDSVAHVQRHLRELDVLPVDRPDAGDLGLPVRIGDEAGVGDVCLLRHRDPRVDVGGRARENQQQEDEDQEGREQPSHEPPSPSPPAERTPPAGRPGRHPLGAHRRPLTTWLGTPGTGRLPFAGLGGLGGLRVVRLIGMRPGCRAGDAPGGHGGRKGAPVNGCLLGRRLDRMVSSARPPGFPSPGLMLASRAVNSRHQSSWWHPGPTPRAERGPLCEVVA